MSDPRVIGIQMELSWENAQENRAHAEALLLDRQPRAGSLVALPEMFSSGFSMNASVVAERPGGATEQWLSSIAHRLGIWLVAGLARYDEAGKIGNDALVVNPHGSVAGIYRKQRPFSVGGESEHYGAGQEPLVFRWAEMGVALFICYDLRFPELFRWAARQRPELFVVIASWPDKRIAHWLKLLEARAIENQAYVLGVNRVGDDPSHHYPGRSVIVNPWGEIVADAGEVEGQVESDLDIPSLRSYREKLPFLSDLKPA
jgi:omega-amidase